MTTEQKTNFRKTKDWKDFRKKMASRAVDQITGRKLLKGWQLHHLDTENYTDLNESKFACLNRQTHEVVHWLYRYKDWRTVIKNLADLIQEMEKLNDYNENH